MKGLISTRWEKSDDGQFCLSVSVPANTLAKIYLPKPSTGKVTVTESGKQLWPASKELDKPGVLAASNEGSYIKCLVRGGDYRFCEAP